jgi:quercetin dioxygenase-like cupin family protein
MRFASLAVASVLLAAQSLPPPFPRDGATKLFENDRVAAWDVSWPKGRPTPMHRHTRELVGVFLTGGDRVIVGEDGTRAPTTASAGQAVFAPRGVVHIEEGTSDRPARAIILELMSDGPIGGAPLAEGSPPAFPREGATLLLDNNRVTVWDYKWTEGGTVPRHHHARDAVVIWFENGRLRSDPVTGASSELAAEVGQARFAPRGTIHSETAIGGAPRAIVVEIK